MDNEITIDFKETDDMVVRDYLKQWCELIEKQKNNKVQEPSPYFESLLDNFGFTNIEFDNGKYNATRDSYRYIGIALDPDNPVVANFDINLTFEQDIPIEGE